MNYHAFFGTMLLVFAILTMPTNKYVDCIVPNISAKNTQTIRPKILFIILFTHEI